MVEVQAIAAVDNSQENTNPGLMAEACKDFEAAEACSHMNKDCKSAQGCIAAPVGRQALALGGILRFLLATGRTWVEAC